MPKAFSTEQKVRIRQRLVTAGQGLVNEVGVRKLSIDEVVLRAGISKGSFYAFFPTREDFLLSVLEAWEDQLKAELFARLTDQTLPVRERFAGFFRGAFQLLDREPGLARLASQDVDLLLDRLPADRVAAHQARDRAALEPVLARLAAEGTVDLGVLATLPGLMMAVFSIVVRRSEFPPETYGPTVDLLVEALADRLGGSHG